MGALGYSMSKLANDALKTEVSSQLDIAAESRADELTTFLDDKKSKVELLANEPTLFIDLLQTPEEEPAYTESYERIRERLKKLEQTEEDFYALFLLNMEGIIVGSSSDSYVGWDNSKSGYFIRGKDYAYISGAYLSIMTDKRTIAISVPILDEETEETAGVLVALVNMTEIDRIMSNRTGLRETGEIYLVNKNYYMITPSTYFEDTFLTQEVKSEGTENCFMGRGRPANYGEEESISYENYREVSTIGSYVYISEMEWCLVAELEASEVLAPVQNTLWLLFQGGGIAIFVYFLIIYWLNKMISKPIEILHHGTEIIEKGNLNHKVGMKSKDEIGQLSRSFDKMTTAIKKSRAEVDKKVEEQTKDLKKFKLAVDNASDQIIITDSEGIVLYVNKAVGSVTGHSIKKIIGQKAGSLWGKQMDSKFYKRLWKTIKGKRSFSGEVNNLRKNGKKYIAELDITPILDDSGEIIFFVGMERDVTKAKEVDRMKSEFISLASHQLRTPLSAVRWFGGMLLNGDAGKLSKKQEEFLGNIRGANDRMIALVDSLLNIARIESGRIIIEPEPTSLADLVKEILKDLEQRIKAKNLKVIVSANENLPEINIDPKLIGEVYNNILTNAIKYTPEGGEITVFISSKENDIISRISDNGVGVPKEEQDKMFEKFFRGTNILKVDTKGSGLGMYLIKEIVETSGGKIWFKSEENKGTTFWFTLPKKGMKGKKGEITLNI